MLASLVDIYLECFLGSMMKAVSNDHHYTHSGRFANQGLHRVFLMIINTNVQHTRSLLENDFSDPSVGGAVWMTKRDRKKMVSVVKTFSPILLQYHYFC